MVWKFIDKIFSCSLPGSQVISLIVINNRAFDAKSTKFDIVIVLIVIFKNLMRSKIVDPQCVFYRPEYCALDPNFNLLKNA